MWGREGGQVEKLGWVGIPACLKSLEKGDLTEEALGGAPGRGNSWPTSLPVSPPAPGWVQFRNYMDAEDPRPGNMCALWVQ